MRSAFISLLICSALIPFSVWPDKVSANSNNTIITTKTSVQIPLIKQVTPTNCLTPGTTITIQGNQFGSGQSGQGVKLSPNNSSTTPAIDMNIVRWSTNTIITTVPIIKAPDPSVTFTLSIRTSISSQWTSAQNYTTHFCLSDSSSITIKKTKTNHDQVAINRIPTNNTATPEETIKNRVEQSEVSHQNLTSPNPTSMGGFASQPSDLVTNNQNAQLTFTNNNLKKAINEIIALSKNMDEAKQLANELASLGYKVIRRKLLSNMGKVLSTFAIPNQAKEEDTQKTLNQFNKKLIIDFNHNYELLSSDNKTIQYAKKKIAWNNTTQCQAKVSIGIIDTTINTDHPSLKNAHYITQSFLVSGINSAPSDHGTSVLSLLIGNGAHEINGLLTHARIYAAEVFKINSDEKISTNAETLYLALDWLIGEKVTIINFSLGGPYNLILESGIEELDYKGISIVAAAGNAGPSSPPVYPAAFDSVIAVTALDARNQIYPKANQGDYIDYAAPGVDVWGAAKDGGRYLSGTSFAAPFVTAALAIQSNIQPQLNLQQRLKEIDNKAIDLGKKGKDSVFGKGLIQTPTCN